mgnify:CR=1 FL=1
MEGEKEIQKIETPTHNASHNEAGKQKEVEEEESLSEKALEDDLELNEEDLDRLPI